MSTPLDVDTRRALAELRAAFSPTANDAARVRAAMKDALLAELRTGSPEPDEMSHPAVSVEGRGFARWPAVLAGVAALFAAWGYYAWQRSPAREIPQAAPSEMTEASSPTAASAEARRQPDTPFTEARLPAPVASAGSQPRRRTQARRDSIQPRIAEPKAAPSLDAQMDELRVLQRVEELQRDGRPDLALSLLRQLDRSVPVGKLREERAAAFSLARCATHIAGRAAVLRDFARRYPASVYLARIKRGCEKSRQTSMPQDTSSQKLPPSR